MRVVNATQLLGGRNLIHEGNAVIFKGILMYLSLPSPPSGSLQFSPMENIFPSFSASRKQRN